MIVWHCCCCLGSGASALFSLLGIFILLDNADKILKVLGIIILSIFVIAFIYGVFTNIVNIIHDIRRKSRHRKWESYKRHAMWGNHD